ncbi:hypothetical protein [Polaribacter sargassicola]|uniref:hypothetical protein n=1 Tax=Polaribacter sargassicola TaxID=2836891 RepID=UPI001F1DB9EA|nr:hypothetical protein [Polaribacter sp. DS7-9]MCG1037292.1 hypothetical protein [Polaribacter sp. DS7-9]
MNLTKLHIDCKKNGRKVFESFKHHIKYYPFEGEIDIQGCIDYDIEKEFGRSVLKHHITGNESSIQLKTMCKIVESYKTIIISTCWKYAENFIENKKN